MDGANLSNRLAVVRKVGFVPENPNLFELFSVEYNLKIFARLFDVPFSADRRKSAEIRVVGFS